MVAFLENMSHERRIVLAATLCIFFSFLFSSLMAPPPREDSVLESERAAQIGPPDTEAEAHDWSERPLEEPEKTEPDTKDIDVAESPRDRADSDDPFLQTSKPEARLIVVDTPRVQYVFSTQGASLRSCRLKDYAENDPPVQLLEAERDTAFDPDIKTFWQARIEEILDRKERIDGQRFKKGDTIPEEAWVELVPQYEDQKGFPLLLRFESGRTDDSLIYKCSREDRVEILAQQGGIIRFEATTDAGVTIAKTIQIYAEDPAFTLKINTTAEKGREALHEALGKYWVLEWPDGLGHFPFFFKGAQEINQIYALVDDSKDNSPTLRRWLVKEAAKTSSGAMPEDYRSDLNGMPLGKKVDWINVETRYFIATFLPQGSEMPGVYIANGVMTRPQFDTRIGMGVKSWVSEDESAVRVYIGPKLTHVLADLGYGLERVVYDTWFGKICLLVEWLLAVFYSVIPSYGVAIILLCILSKLVLYPLTYKQAQTQMKMAELQPKVKELQERFKDDKQKLSQEQMKLWKKHGVNPASGCLPMLAQFPIFIALYRTVQSSIDLRGAPFLWIDDLSLPDMTFFLPSPLPLIGVAINILPLVMTGISVLQMQQQMKSMPDQSQAQMMRFMPIMFLFILYNFGSGLVLYWTFNSLTQWAQQKMMERLGHAHSPAQRAIATAAATDSKLEPDDETPAGRPKKKIPPQRKNKPRKKRAGSRR